MLTNLRFKVELSQCSGRNLMPCSVVQVALFFKGNTKTNTENKCKLARFCSHSSCLNKVLAVRRCLSHSYQQRTLINNRRKRIARPFCLSVQLNRVNNMIINLSPICLTTTCPVSSDRTKLRNQSTNLTAPKPRFIHFCYAHVRRHSTLNYSQILKFGALSVPLFLFDYQLKFFQ
jgi:hypothetical protein